MTYKPCRIVLLVSELNDISESFHRFPEQPVGMVEVNIQRRSKRQWTPSACAKYCKRFRLKYACIGRDDLAAIGQYLNEWDAELLITHSVPLLPMDLIHPLKYGGLNLHHSALPAYRGGNPLLWQTLDAVKIVGVTLHVLSAHADAGDIVGQCQFTRPTALTKSALARKANTECGLPLLLEHISDWVNGKTQAVPQPENYNGSMANHFPMQELLPKLVARQASLATLWETAKFLGYWPPESVPANRWAPWFRWVPVTVVQHDPTVPLNEAFPAYQFQLRGLTLRLHHTSGYVVFRPVVHVQTILAKLLL